MNTIDQTNWKGKKALIRVDFNVPLNAQHQIMDYTRIEGAMSTIEHILDQEGSVILMSHMGRPNGEYDEHLSLKHLLPELERRLKRNVKFSPECRGKIAQDMARHLKNGEILLLENLRFCQEETQPDVTFASELASLGDAYVNDAFATLHRSHTSITEVPKYFKEKYGGELLEQEFENIDIIREKPRAPLTIVLGGAKVGTKIKTLEEIIDRADNILIGGAISYTFIKAREGDIGDSLVDDERVRLAYKLMNKAKRNKVNIVLPQDSVVKEHHQEGTKIVDSKKIKKGQRALDIGPKTQEAFSEIIRNSNTIFWNGPMGVFEDDRFENGTREIAQAIADATERGAHTVVGGGDTTAAISKFFLQGSFWHVSTGGGSLLRYLEKKNLPGVQALEVAPELVY